MKNYAKFCKINIDDKKYQLNLTEVGFDASRFTSKIFSVLRLVAPILLLVYGALTIFDFITLKTLNVELFSKFLSSGIFSFTFCTPITRVGKAYGAIFKSYFVKNKTIDLYEDLRRLERLKQKNKNYNKIIKKQSKLINKFLNYCKKNTNKFNKTTKKYYRIKENKGYVDGLNAFALENLEMNQETLDKFIFHNVKLLLKLSPNNKNFILDRFEKRLKILTSENEAYYDEYVWAVKNNEDIIKNDCINKNETSTYLEELKTYLNLDSETEIKTTTLDKIETNNQQVFEEKLESEKKIVKQNLDSNSKCIYNEENINNL